MRWFFYGTLMDHEMLEIVLGRRIAPSRFVEAYLRGYRRCFVRGEPYPAITPAPGELTAGVLISLEAEQDEARLRHYEGDGYRVIAAPLETIDGERMSARVFANDGSLSLEKRIWDYRLWRNGHGREDMIEQARLLMLEFTV